MPRSTTSIIYSNCLLAVVFLITLCPYSISQKDENIDSLIQLANKIPDDSSKVELLVKIGMYFNELYNLPEAKKVSFEALAICEKIQYKEGLVKSNNLLGSIFRNERNFPETLKYQENALKIAEQIGNKSLLGLAYYGIGYLYQKMQKYSQAQPYFLKGLNAACEAGDKVIMIRINNSLGLIYDFSSDYPTALKYYLSSLKIAEEIGDQYGIGAANVNIGIIHSYLGDYNANLKHNLVALKIWKETGYKRNLADAYTNIGESYANLENIPEAEKYTMMGVDLAKQIKYNRALGAGLSKMGIIAWMKKDYRTSLKYYLESLQVWESEGNHFKIAATLIFVGKGYNELHQYQKAISYFKKALLLSGEIGNNYDMADAFKLLSGAEVKLGNYKEALTHYQAYIGIMDSIMSQEKIQQMAKMTEEYEIDKKEKEIQILKKEKGLHELQLKQHIQAKNFSFMGIALVLILSFIAYKYYNNRQELKLLTIRNKIAIDLHDDVGSTLSSISMFSQMAQAQSKEHIPALETIGESSRKMLEAMADIVWSIKPENDLFEKVIMRMRGFAFELLGTKQIDFEFDADEDISKFNLAMEVKKNLYLIFKEATNNMAKYSAANRAKFILKGEKDKLMMLISDNGNGFDSTKEFRGNGLVNMKKRAFEMGAHLFIDSIPGKGTTIRLEINV